MEDKLTKQLNIAIGIVFVIAAGVLIYSAANRTPATTNPDENQQTPVPSQPQPPQGSATNTVAYEALQGMKSVQIAQNFETWTPNGKVDAAKTKSVRLAVTGNVSKAYLLVKASESSNALTRWQSVYFKLNYDGGHLFRPQSLPTSDTKTTTMLFNMEDVAYLPSVPYSEDRTPARVNLLALLKAGTHPLITSFISSLNQTVLEQEMIYYACETGSECSITVQ